MDTNSQAEQRLTKLEDKLQRKDEVIAEIMAEHILLKKVLGKVERELGRP